MARSSLSVRGRDEGAAFLFALQFLTRIPIPAAVEFTAAREQAAVGYYAAVGAVVGILGGIVWYVSQLWVPDLLAILLSVAATLLLTGAFHEDGLADTFDGIGGGGDAERVLQIMKDSRIGTYGSVALILVLSVKITTLHYLAEVLPGLIALLIVAHSCSRASSVMVVLTSRYVRTQGTAKPTASGISGSALGVTLFTSFVIVIAGLLMLTPAALGGGLVGLAVGHGFSRLLYERKLGGYTGDCLGATQQLSEAFFYLGVLVCL
ncbi:MAG: adenosylcobinamide-GDP ribazoletransferase [Pseudomonadota bacterium]